MNIDKKFLLVCLQLIIVLLMSMNVEGMPSLTESSMSIQIQRSFNSNSNSNNERAYRLYNQCAFQDVLIQANRVSATANESDDRGNLVFESRMNDEDDFPRIRIRGLRSGKYLCYNRRGKLVARPKNKARGARCEFFERPGAYGTWRYMSALKKFVWYMGFDSKGRPRLGSDHISTDRPECFTFNKNGRFLSDQVPEHLKDKHFDPDRHNEEIGEIHPHLGQGFFSNSRKSLYFDLLWTSTSTSTPSPPPSTTPPPPVLTTQPPPPPKPQDQPHYPLRHHRNQGKSHHAHLRQRHNKKSQRNRKSSSSISTLPKTLSAADR